MPIYEYRCDSCQHIFEELQSYSDPAPEACPACAESSVRRMISNTTFQLKGDGWFAPQPKASSPAASASTESSVAPSVVADANSTSSAVPATAEPAASATKTTKIDV